MQYSTVLLTTPLLRCGHTVLLHIQDGLLVEKDQKLPFARHVVGAMEYFYIVEDFIFVGFVGMQEVVVSDSEGKIIISPIDAVMLSKPFV